MGVVAADQVLAAGFGMVTALVNAVATSDAATDCTWPSSGRTASSSARRGIGGEETVGQHTTEPQNHPFESGVAHDGVGLGLVPAVEVARCDGCVGPQNSSAGVWIAGTVHRDARRLQESWGLSSFLRGIDETAGAFDVDSACELAVLVAERWDDGGQVHDRIRRGAGHEGIDGRSVGEIDPFDGQGARRVGGIGGQLPDRLAAGGVSRSVAVT